MKQRLAWITVFCALNSVFLWLLNFQTLWGFFPLELTDTHAVGSVFVTFYIFMTYFSYFALLPFAVLILPGLVIPWPRVARVLAIILMSLLAEYLLVDGGVFRLYRFHLNETLLEFVFGGQADEMFGFSTLEWGMIVGVTLGIFLIEMGLAKLATRWYTISTRLWRRSLLLMGTLLIFSYLTLILSMGYGISAFSQQAKVFPYYQRVLASLLRIEPQFFEHFAEGRFVQLKEISGTLDYPHHPLVCQAQQRPMNILVIGIDAWRFDHLRSDVMPFTTEWSQSNLVFNQHYSGGNNTRSGLFSLFYGLPSTYWTAFLQAQRSPVLMDELKRQQYQFGIFSSGELVVPPFDKTIFANIHPLQTRMPGKTSVERDRQATQQFLEFLPKTATPFFAFLFYVAPQSYCSAQELPNRFKPSIQACLRLARNNETDPIPYLNRYRNALFSVDQELKTVLNQLKAQGQYDNTIVILTSDHGQEFNDNHQNYWEHAGNFTRYQMQVPLIVHWPGKKQQQIDYQTSHYDIAPTLIQDALHCQNPPKDYSLGLGLFNPSTRPYLIATSYVNVGILEPDRITILPTTGQIEIQDLNAKPLPNAKPHFPILKDAMRDIRYFFN